MIATAAHASQERIWSQIIARVWSDDEFKNRFITDPRSVLAEHGIELAADIVLNVVEDSETLRHVVLPPAPTHEMSEEELVGKSAAWCYSGACGRCGCGCGRCRCGCY